MTRLCFDYDPILYTAGSVGETRTIKVVHRESGDEAEFANRTAFWGHWKKKAGGYLAEWNSVKAEHNRRKPEDFDIVDVQVAGPLANCLHTMKQVITGITEAVGVDDGYYGYSGRGTVFREDVSTVIKYKGNRDGALRPVLLDDLKAYLEKHHACRIIEKIEADDACTIDQYTAYQRWKETKSDKDKLVLAYVDKDYLGTTAHLYNTTEAKGIDSYDGFGYLSLDTTCKPSKVRGRGRMWLYYQTMNGDDSDNYFANSANPDVKWADMSAYNVLKDCKTDKEAFEAMLRGYRLIYPAPKKIIGWRGDELTVDAMYMLQENFTLARMLRWENDNVDVKLVMDSLGVDYKDTP